MKLLPLIVVLSQALSLNAVPVNEARDTTSNSSSTSASATSAASSLSSSSSTSTSLNTSSIAVAIETQVSWALDSAEYEAVYDLALQANEALDSSSDSSSSSSSMGGGGSSSSSSSSMSGGGGGSSSSSSSSDDEEVTTYTEEHPWVAWTNASESGALGNDAITKAKALVAKMTTAEKIDVITSSSVSSSGTSISSLGYSGYSTLDGAYGVSDSAGVSGWLASINMAATFNRSLINAIGRGMGAEFRGKGYGAQGPFLNLYNAPLAGRSKESYGADPYVSGECAEQIFSGFKEAETISVGKHLIANDWETNRSTVNKTMGSRTLHEVYLRPWSKAIAAGMNGAMCAMNMYNASWSCSNAALINGEIKGRLNFQGYIVPDVDAQKSELTAGINGLDSGTWTDLADYISNDTFPLARLDDMAVRVVGAWYATNQDTNPMANSTDVEYLNVQSNHSTLITQAGEQSIVVLKNVNSTLPLKTPTGIAIIGNDASAPERGPNGFDSGDFLSSNFSVAGHFAGQGEGCPTFPWLISPLEAISARARKDNTAVTWSINNTDYAWMIDEATGDIPYGSIAASSTTVADTFSASMGPIDTCIVFGNVVAGEGFDRDTWDMDQTVQNAIWLTAKSCNNTIVVMNTVGSVNVEAWADHPNITAIVWAGLPGQNSGEALANILYGDANPSGKLPFTWGHNLTDYPYQINSSAETVDYDADFSGLLIDYRYFDYYNITPRFAFGHGLSYTTFDYSDANVQEASSSSDSSSKRNLVIRDTETATTATETATETATTATETEAATDTETTATATATATETTTTDSTVETATTTATTSATTTSTETTTATTATVTEAVPSLQPDLEDEAYTITFTLKNTGSVAGCEVSQLYLGYTTTTYGTQPPRVLRGFEKTCLDAGSQKDVTFTLLNSDVFVWSVFDDDWVAPNGSVDYYIGTSSRDLLLNGTLTS